MQPIQLQVLDLRQAKVITLNQLVNLVAVNDNGTFIKGVP